jgi:guanylate kinase
VTRAPGRDLKNKREPVLPQHAHSRGILFVISGPSGVGKTSLCQQVVAEMHDVKQSVSYTTRAPRPEEHHGREYHFTSRKDFEQRVRAGEFLEWAQVHGQLYGTSQRQVETVTRSGTDVLLAIDVQGATQLRASGVDAVFIFLVPPSWQVLSERIQKRGSETPEIQKQRLSVAHKELGYYTEYDYIVVNDRLSTAVDQVRAILMSERHRVMRVGSTVVEGLLACYSVLQAPHRKDKG